MHHAGIIAALDFAVSGDPPFQVLELVDGWDASQLLREAKARGQSSCLPYLPAAAAPPEKGRIVFRSSSVKRSCRPRK